MKIKERRGLARKISDIENLSENSFRLLAHLSYRKRKAFRIGVTGLPGAGKSTIIHQLARFFLKKSYSIGILLVDPSSPYTGGAILGDRVRLKSIQGCDRVFIRSMASRGELGGLAFTTKYAANLLEDYRFDIILIETVGMGQVGIDIAHAAEITLVVLTPTAGDELQLMKAGLMESADLFLINKMDLDPKQIYFSKMKKALEDLRAPIQKGVDHIFPLIAEENVGIEKLGSSLLKLKNYKKPLHPAQTEEELYRVISNLLLSRLKHNPQGYRVIQMEVEKILKGKRTAIQSANEVIRKSFRI